MLSVVALVGVLWVEIERGGGDGKLALLVLATPGVFSNLRYIGPESLATALVVAGTMLWSRRRGSGWAAVACLALAGLCRETMLIVPAALALAEQLSPRSGPLRSWKPAAWRMASAALPLVAWIGLLRIRLGVFPEPSNETLLAPFPLAGIVRGLGNWDLTDLLAAALVVGAAGVLLLVSRREPWRPVVLAFAGFSLFVGETMWADDTKFGRLLLPLSAFAVLALGRLARRTRPTIASGSPATPRTTDPVVAEHERPMPGRGSRVGA